MAIARRSLKSVKSEAEQAASEPVSGLLRGVREGKTGAAAQAENGRHAEAEAVEPQPERGAQDSPPRSAFGLFRKPLTRLRNRRSVEEEAGEEMEFVHPPMLRPTDLQKMGFVAPVYSLSRSVTLNPRVMSANRCVAFLPDCPEVEFYRQLRTRILQISGGKGGATVMVTSALPGEGKTLTAINLALTFAREFKQTALLVDCDLRQQQVHSLMGFPSERGLVDYLMDDCPITELFVWPGVEKLSVISGGRTVRDSCELLGSPGMMDLVQEMKHRYPERYVFFDTPSILISADAVAFAPLVDYILVVAQAGQTSLKDITRAVELLPPEKVLGLVMNRH
jgi:protein-tyrosine kinase